jgi:hypothetical protein
MRRDCDCFQSLLALSDNAGLGKLCRNLLAFVSIIRRCLFKCVSLCLHKSQTEFDPVDIEYRPIDLCFLMEAIFSDLNQKSASITSVRPKSSPLNSNGADL